MGEVDGGSGDPEPRLDHVSGFQTCPRKLEEKRGEAESNFLAELKGFQGDPGKELALPNQWSRVEMRALVAAAESLNMRVVEEEERVRVVKECGL